MEAKYHTLAQAATKIVWLQSIFIKLGITISLQSLFCGVIIKVLVPWLLILCFMLEQNISRSMYILFMNELLLISLMFNIFQLMIK